MNSKIMKLPAVIAATTLSRSSIYDFVKRGKFPAPVKLSERAVGWLESEIAAYINERAKQRESGGAYKSTRDGTNGKAEDIACKVQGGTK